MTEIQRVQDSVRLFLTAWLVDRDLDTAKSAFGKAAFKNDALLQDSCARYIKSDDRGSDIAIKAGIQEFLQDYLPKTAVTFLDQVLNRQAIAPLAGRLELKPANNPETDLFILVKLLKSQLPAGESWETDYLKKNIPSDFYALFVPIGEGVIYFLWIPQGNRWVIYHASVFCM